MIHLWIRSSPPSHLSRRLDCERLSPPVSVQGWREIPSKRHAREYGCRAGGTMQAHNLQAEMPPMTDPTQIEAIARLCDRATVDGEGVAGVDYLPACAAEAVIAIPALAARCRGCAFTPGTDAADNPVTSNAASECVERSHPFFCHMVKDDLREPTHLCAGWIEALTERASSLAVREYLEKRDG